MSEMIERMAGQIAASLRDSLTAEQRAAIDFPTLTFTACARMAAETMREPTEAMLAAGARLTLISGTESGCYEDHHPAPARAYQAMIDSILGESK